MQCAILCGGYATRLYPLTQTVAKSMLLFKGKPFLEHQLNLLKKSKIREIVLITGFLENQIVDYFGSGKKFGVELSYCQGNQYFGTAYALLRAKPQLQEQFLLMYGDSYLQMDYSQVWEYFLKQNALAMMAVRKNTRAQVVNNLDVRNGWVTAYDSHDSKKHAFIDYGLTVLQKKVLDALPIPLDFQHSQLFQFLVKQKQLLAFETQAPIYEIGSFEGLEKFKQFAEKNL